MIVEVGLLTVAGFFAGWLAVAMRRGGDTASAVEHSLLAVGLLSLASTLYVRTMDRVAPYIFFAAVVGRLWDWYWVRLRRN